MPIGRGFFVALALAGLLVTSGAALAAEAPPASTPVPSEAVAGENADYKKLFTALQKEYDEFKLQSTLTDLALAKSYLDYQNKRFEYEKSVIDINVAAFWYQQTAGKIILLLSVAIVSCALWFTYLQLKAGLVGYAEAIRLMQRRAPGDPTPRPGESPPAPGAAQFGNGDQSKIEIGLDKFSATTSIVGVMILIISLGFVYLYLEKAYKITYVEVPGIKTNALQSGDGSDVQKPDVKSPLKSNGAASR